MEGSRRLIVLTLAVGVAACGGSHQRTGATRPANPPGHSEAASAPAPLLPVSPAGPTTCTVYESGYATQVIFDSKSLNVSGECQAWTSRQSGAGYLWAYQPTGAAIATAAVPMCSLRDPSGRVTATVVEDAGWAAVSSGERAKIAHACTSLLAAGWERAVR